MHNEMPVSGAGITGSAFPEWRFPLYRNSGFHDRTGGVKQPGILTYDYLFTDFFSDSLF